MLLTVMNNVVYVTVSHKNVVNVTVCHKQCSLFY